MTDEERDFWRLEMRERLAELQHQIAEMKETIDKVDDFLMQPRAPGKPSRASELDDWLSFVRAGGLGVRTLIGFAAIVAAIGSIVAAVRFGGQP